MRFVCSKGSDKYSLLIRIFSKDGEVAYSTLGLSGLQAEIEFPSDWHEQKRAWVRIGFGLFRVCFSFPWEKTVSDEYQCSGPTYGFQFYSDLLWIKYGKSKGKSTDPILSFYMPWSWKHREHTILSAPETHGYIYRLNSGEIQNRTATIQVERRKWTRCWLPFRMVKTYIDIQFSSEVGESSGSWKGGCIGCSYDMLPGETPLQTLRRMESERKF